MKTGPNNFSCQRWIICVCLVLSAMTARCQPFGGIIVNGTIDLKGNNVTFDSFNSSDPRHSVWQTSQTFHGTNYGLYSDALSYASSGFTSSAPARTADITVAAEGAFLNAVNVNIYGYADTTPDSFTSLAIY